MQTKMTEAPEIVVSLKPTDLDNLLSPEYTAKSLKLLRAHRAAPALVDQFIRAANDIELAWAGGDLAGAVRALLAIRKQAKELEL